MWSMFTAITRQKDVYKRQGKKMINIFMGGTNMKATGIVRPVDPLGRVVIPVELRSCLLYTSRCV